MYELLLHWNTGYISHYQNPTSSSWETVIRISDLNFVPDHAQLWTQSCMIITSLLTKFHQNPTSSLWQILLTNKQTNKKNGTRRALIPRKPLDPPIFLIVAQSLIFQITDPFCVFASTQFYKRPFLWSSCDSVQQWCRRDTPEMKIVCWIPGDHEIL